MASTVTRLTLTDDTGTAANPVGDGTPLDNDFLWDYVYAPIDQMFSGVGAYATFTFGGLLAAAGFGTHGFSSAGTGGNILSVRNTTAGTTNYAAVNLGNDVSATAARIVQSSSTYTTAAPLYQDGLTVQCDRSGGLTVAATHAAGVVRFTSGGSSERMRLSATGGLSIGSTNDAGPGGLLLNGAINTGLTITDGTTIAIFKSSGLYTNSFIIATYTNHPLLFSTNLGSVAGPQMVLGTGGALYIGDSANAKMTAGLTINQGANDDEILAFKSSGDISHGMTAIMEATTYGSVKKCHPTQGGVMATGCSTTTGPGWTVMGAQATPDTAKSTAANGAVNINGAAQSGTGVASLGTNGNIATFRDNGTTRQILDADGDSHQDVGTAWTNFDSHDDALVLSSLAVAVSRPGDPWRDAIRQSFAGALGSLLPRRELARLKLVTFNRNGRHFVNMSKLTMLHTGAIRQLARELVAVRAALPPAARLSVERRLEAARG